LSPQIPATILLILTPVIWPMFGPPGFGGFVLGLGELCVVGALAAGALAGGRGWLGTLRGWLAVTVGEWVVVRGWGFGLAGAVVFETTADVRDATVVAGDGGGGVLAGG